MHIQAATTPADLETCYEIYLAATNGRLLGRGESPIALTGVSWLTDSLPHLARTDPDGLVLATDGDRPIGFGCAYRRERFWYLSQLQVIPERQGEGVGTALLDRLLPPPSERGSTILATSVEAAQPVSTMLYARRGIVPRVPCYWMDGLRSLVGLPRLPDGIEHRPMSPAAEPSVAAFDRSLLGYARPADHEQWLREAEEARVYVTADGEVAGYGYRSPGWLSPIAGFDEHLVPAIMRDLLAGADGALDEVTVGVPGDSVRLLPALLAAGMRADAGGASMIYCSTGPSLPPSYLIYGGHHP